MKPICRRCGAYVNVLVDGLICPKCNFHETIASSDSTTPIEIDISQIKTYTDGQPQSVWTKEELIELIKEVIKEERESKNANL